MIKLSYRYSQLLVISILLAVVSCQSDTKSSNSELENESTSSEKLNILEAEFEDLNGNPIQLSDFKGKAVFLNFWATWCKPCIYEMPSISRANEILGEDVIFLAASDESMKRIKNFRDKNPEYNFKIIRIKESVIKYGIQVLPTTYLISSDGEISSVEVGGKEWDNPSQIEMIKNLGG